MTNIESKGKVSKSYSILDSSAISTLNDVIPGITKAIFQLANGKMPPWKNDRLDFLINVMESVMRLAACWYVQGGEPINKE